jgi:cyclase
MIKIFKIIGVSVAAMIVILLAVGWFSFKKSMQVKEIKPDNNLVILLGGGGNSIVLTSGDGSKALVVDTKMGGASKEMAAKVKAKEVVVVNTHLHRDHAAGNNLFPGAKLITGLYMPDQWKAMAPASKFPDRMLKPGEDTVIAIGDEKAHIRSVGPAHTWNDVVVYLENRKLLLTGDIVFYRLHPAMFVQGGTNVAAWMAVLDSLSAHYDVKTLVPGHGALADKQALSDMKEYFTTMEAAIGNPEKMKEAKEKYKSYPEIPLMASFARTLEFIGNEKKTKQQ